MATTPDQPSGEAVQAASWSRARQWRWIAGLVLVAAVLAGGYWFAHRHDGAPEAAAAADAGGKTFRPSAEQLKTLRIEPVALRAFQGEERTDGKIAVNGDRATPVYSPYSGRVTQVLAGIGDVVAAGAPLAMIEATEFAQAQSDLNTAAAAAKLARINESRKHALFDAKGGSLQDWQQAEADLATAEAALKAARNKLSILGKSAEQIAQMEHAEAASGTALVPIVAPLAGVVVDRQVGPGQYLQAGASTPVYTVADVGTVWLVANVRETGAASVRRGQPVEVRVAAYPGRTFVARVTSVAATVDPATHRVTVRAEIDNKDGALKPEMFASFRILTGAAAQSPGVPEAAVVYEGDSAHVWVVHDGQSIEYRSIKPGRTIDGWVEVRDGLAAGEQIVTKGSLFIDRAARGN